MSILTWNNKLLKPQLCFKEGEKKKNNKKEAWIQEGLQSFMLSVII